MKNSFFISFTFLVFTSFVHESPAKEHAAGGKIYFSNQPFTTSNAGSKTSFSSGEFIYGRLELDGQTVKEAFKISDKSVGAAHGFLFYTVTIFFKDREVGSNLTGSPRKILLKEKDKQNRWLNFDVLPEPVKASTVLMSSEKLNASRSTVPFYRLVDTATFKENGEYRVVVKLSLHTYDTSGKTAPEAKWPGIEGGFTFNFNREDIARIRKNEKEADAAIRETVFDLAKLPEAFTTPSKITDPNLSAEKISAILKRDITHLAVIKFALGPYKDSLWRIDTTQKGEITQKTLVPRVYIAYKKDDKCFVDNVQLAMKHLGEGVYGQVRVYNSPVELRKPQTINCNKIN